MPTHLENPRLALAFILTTLAINAMGIGLVLPVMPDLIQQIDGGSVATAAEWGGIFATAYAIMQFLCGPLIGTLSDRYGRRPLLIGALAIMAVDYLVIAQAQSLWVLLIARFVGGIAASTQSTATAFVADITPAKDKSARFGLVGAAFGVGFVLGPLLGGILAEFGTRAPFYAAAALSALNLALGYFVLPETVTDEIRRPFSWRRANPVGALLDLGTRAGVTRLTLLFFLYQVAFFVYPAIWAYFAKARFGWDPRMVGISLGLFGVALAVVQGGLIRWVLKTFGERSTVIYGITFNGCAFVALAFVKTGVVALVLTPMTALGAVVMPALQGILSRAIPDDAQGGLQGLLMSAGALAMTLSNFLMTQVFAYFTRDSAPIHLPGAPFLVSMALMAVCLWLFVNRTPTDEERESAQAPTDESDATPARKPEAAEAVRA